MISPTENEYVVMQDSDCLHLKRDNIERAIAYLTAKTACPYVALPWKDGDLCLNARCKRLVCIVARPEFLSGARFWVDQNRCTCQQLEAQAIAQGRYPRYITGIGKMIVEIRRTHG
jgi:hypothetical protein